MVVVVSVLTFYFIASSSNPAVTCLASDFITIPRCANNPNCKLNSKTEVCYIHLISETNESERHNLFKVWNRIAFDKERSTMCASHLYKTPWTFILHLKGTHVSRRANDLPYHFKRSLNLTPDVTLPAGDLDNKFCIASVNVNVLDC